VKTVRGSLDLDFGGDRDEAVDRLIELVDKLAGQLR
jgi:hypothetical protein